MPQLVFGDQSTSRKEAVLTVHHVGLGNQTPPPGLIAPLPAQPSELRDVCVWYRHMN